MKTFHKFTLLFLFLSIFNATLSCSSNDKTLPQPIPDIEEEEEETKDVVLPEDIQIIPYGGKASEYQPGSDIDKSYDGKFTQGIRLSSHIITVHGVIHPSLSLWNISSKEIRKSITLFIIPDQGMVILVRLKFTPLPIPIEKRYTLQGTYDFKMKDTPSRIVFKKGMKATGVKFVVKSGLGNFVSCDEMHFFKKRMRITLWQLSY